ADGPGGDAMAEAEAVRGQLQEALARTARLVALLRRQRRQGRAVQAAVDSLRKLRDLAPRAPNERGGDHVGATTRPRLAPRRGRPGGARPPPARPLRPRGAPGRRGRGGGGGRRPARPPGTRAGGLAGDRGRPERRRPVLRWGGGPVRGGSGPAIALRPAPAAG